MMPSECHRNGIARTRSGREAVLMMSEDTRCPVGVRTLSGFCQNVIGRRRRCRNADGMLLDDAPGSWMVFGICHQKSSNG